MGLYVGQYVGSALARVKKVANVPATINFAAAAAIVVAFILSFAFRMLLAAEILFREWWLRWICFCIVGIVRYCAPCGVASARKKIENIWRKTGNVRSLTTHEETSFYVV